MANKFTIRGGAQIGWVYASWPLARFDVSPGELGISGRFVASYSFTPDQVVALKPYGWIPIFGRGVQIAHARPDYPAKIVFWTFQNPERLIEKVHQAGFRPCATPSRVQNRKGIPVRWRFILLTIVVWNTLFILDGLAPWNKPKPPGPLVLLALGLVFTTSFAVRRSPRLQAWVLEPGRSIGEIQPALSLIQLVSGLLFVFSTLFALVGWPNG